MRLLLLAALLTTSLSATAETYICTPEQGKSYTGDSGKWTETKKHSVSSDNFMMKRKGSNEYVISRINGSDKRSCTITLASKKLIECNEESGRFSLHRKRMSYAHVSLSYADPQFFTDVAFSEMEFGKCEKLAE